MRAVPEASPQHQDAAGARDDSGRRQPGRLLREAARLLEATDLRGANETLKQAEEALVLRKSTARRPLY